MKKKLLTILISLSSFTAYANLEICRQSTVGFSDYMEQLAQKYEENEEAIKIRNYVNRIEKFYRNNIEGYGHLYEYYKNEDMNEEAEKMLKDFYEEATEISEEIEIATQNRYKLKITLSPDEYGEMKVNWYVSYGQIIKNDKAEKFKSRQELYKNIKTDRPAIFNTGKNLIGAELRNSKMVEFESIEMMPIYINKDIYEKCKKYLDFIETKRDLKEAVLSGSSKQDLSKSFVYMIRNKDKKYYKGPLKLSFDVRSTYYKNVTEALNIYDLNTENMNNENRMSGYEFRSNEDSSSTSQNSYSTQE